MSKKRITLSIESSVYEKYRKYCDENGIILSKQVELFIRNKLKEIKDA